MLACMVLMSVYDLLCKAASINMGTFVVPGFCLCVLKCKLSSVTILGLRNQDYYICIYIGTYQKSILHCLFLLCFHPSFFSKVTSIFLRLLFA